MKFWISDKKSTALEQTRIDQMYLFIRKRAQKDAKESFRVEIANNQVWFETTRFGNFQQSWGVVYILLFS